MKKYLFSKDELKDLVDTTRDNVLNRLEEEVLKVLKDSGGIDVSHYDLHSIVLELRGRNFAEFREE